MAGGGIKGGTIYGATDEFGFKAVENPVSVHDLHATMLHLLGFGAIFGQLDVNLKSSDIFPSTRLRLSLALVLCKLISGSAG